MEQKITKNCQNCNNNFIITEDDQQFYAKIDVPMPIFCPDCRLQRRLAFRNESILYWRNCDLCKKKMVSVYHKDSPYKAYCQKCWWSDNWDPMEYGQEYDFNKPFFEQFDKLWKNAPVPNLTNTNAVNSDYINSTLNIKDSYLIFGAVKCENCYYCTYLSRCKDSLDLYSVLNVELCYESIFLNQSFKVFFSKYTNNSYDSSFLYDCRNVSNCFGSINLRNKKYYIFNKQYTKQEYFKKIKEMDLGSYSNLIEIKEKFNDLENKYPRKYARIINSDNCTGDNIKNSKNCKDCFDVKDGGLKNCKNIFHPYGNIVIKNSRLSDFIGQGAESCYESISVNACSNIYYSKKIWTGFNINYSYNCFNCSNLFGCISLRNKQYCILNKQYSKQEYEKLALKIREHTG